MSRKQTVLLVSLFAFACLAIGVIWTVRTAPPSLHPWWGGKNATVRVEVWEDGKDMATVGMTWAGSRTGANATKAMPIRSEVSRPAALASGPARAGTVRTARARSRMPSA